MYSLLMLFCIDTIPTDLGTYLPEVNIYADHQQRVETLARLVYSESGNQSLMAKKAVANVVLNRMEYFDLSLEQVIFKRNQFNGVGTKWFRAKFDKDSYEAALSVLSGERIIQPDILYFANEKRATNKTWIKFISKYKAFQLEDHVFYYDIFARTLYSKTGSFRRRVLP